MRAITVDTYRPVQYLEVLGSTAAHNLASPAARDRRAARVSPRGWAPRLPSERVEDCHWVEVVAPVSDLAIGGRQHGDVPVGVRRAGRDDSAFGGVFEHHHAFL